MLKIKVYKHSSIVTPIDDDIQKIIPYFSSAFVKQYINETITLDVENTTKDYKDDTLFKPNEGLYDTVMFIYEQGTFPVYGSTYSYSNNLRVCYVSINALEDNIDYSWKIMCHEILHSLVYKIMVEKNVFILNFLDQSLPTPYLHNDDPYAIDGNFSQQLKALVPYYKIGYKYFKPSEVVGLKPELVLLLDKARDIAGVPFKITSGYRDPIHNTSVGGVSGSSHTDGTGCDILADTSLKRFKIVSGALQAGFTRIGVYNNHIHLDIGKLPNFPQDVLWVFDKE